jgi:hypothetical protein
MRGRVPFPEREDIRFARVRDFARLKHPKDNDGIKLS